MASPELKTLGRYNIERVLGKGAMGVVYEGVDPRLGRRVAIKTILKSHLDDDTAKDFAMRFVREAQAVARLNHPHIVQVYELMWQQSEDATTMASHKSVFKPRNATLRLKVQGAEVVLSSERPMVALGRDQAADLVIRERMASRAHGKIERRLDKFILTDHSANGTFVTVEGDREIVLRREEFTLRGHGWIAFGQSRAAATDVVEFFCE